MSWRLRWIVVAPVVLFVAFTVAMSSCGGSSGCTGSFDQFGNFQAGVCPSPGPGLGFALETIVIGAGTPVPATPTPGPTATRPFQPTPTPTGSVEPTPVPTETPTFKQRTPTPTPSLVPQAQPTTVLKGQQVAFNADGLFKKNKNRIIISDITNSSSTVWTTDNMNVLVPPQPPPLGGIYGAIAGGCACVGVTSGGLSAPPVSVTVVDPNAIPSPSATATPPCPVLCPTAIPTATSTPRGGGGAAIPSEARPAQSTTARIRGVLQWTYQGASPIISPLRASSDGNLYFLTLDGNLHALNAKGHERWSRHAAGKNLAVSSDGTVYALAADGTLEEQSPSGKPLWNMKVDSPDGPVAASASAVYYQEDRQLIAAASPGVIQWRAGAPDEITSAAIAEDGSVIVATAGASVIAIGSDGAHLWSFAPEGGFAGEIAVRGNLVYLGSGRGRLYALDVSGGAQQWVYDTAATIAGGPVLNATGPIFFGSDTIYALNSDGSLAWNNSPAESASRPLAADAEGGVLTPLADDFSAMLNSDGTVRWATGSFGPIERAVISPSGVLYVASHGTIYALK
jgi:outer membrane protein assembly factor BamB